MAAGRSREDKREDILAVLVDSYAEIFDAYPALKDLLPPPRAAHISNREWERRMFRVRNICRLADLCSATGDRRPLHEFVLEHLGREPQRQRALRAMLPDPANETTDEDWIAAFISVLKRLLR